jgi:hypothetical protein
MMNRRHSHPQGCSRRGLLLLLLLLRPVPLSKHKYIALKGPPRRVIFKEAAAYEFQSALSTNGRAFQLHYMPRLIPAVQHLANRNRKPTRDAGSMRGNTLWKLHEPNGKILGTNFEATYKTPPPAFPLRRQQQLTELVHSDSPRAPCFLQNPAYHQDE